MASIAEIARHAGVSVEGVLRVLGSEPVSQEVEDRVREAIAVLGPPHPPQSRTLTASDPVAPAFSRDIPHDDKGHHGEAAARVAATNETHPGRGGGIDTTSAATVDVDSLVESVDALRDLVGDLRHRVEELRRDARKERSAHVADLELLVDLISTSWRTVDGRFATLEDMVRALDDPARRESTGGTVVPLYDHDRGPTSGQAELD